MNERTGKRACIRARGIIISHRRCWYTFHTNDVSGAAVAHRSAMRADVPLLLAPRLSSSSLSLSLPTSLSLLLTPSYTVYLTPFHPLSHGFIMSPPAISGPKVRTYMRRAIACYLSLDSRQTWRTTIAVPIYYNVPHVVHYSLSSTDALPAFVIKNHARDLYINFSQWFHVMIDTS